jgi:hypothetical protein
VRRACRPDREGREASDGWAGTVWAAVSLTSGSALSAAWESTGRGRVDARLRAREEKEMGRAQLNSNL